VPSIPTRRNATLQCSHGGNGGVSVSGSSTIWCVNPTFRTTFPNCETGHRPRDRSRHASPQGSHLPYRRERNGWLSATGASRPWPLPVISHHARHRQSSQSSLSPNVISLHEPADDNCRPLQTRNVLRRTLRDPRQSYERALLRHRMDPRVKREGDDHLVDGLRELFDK
jgi:hypothetical protein